MVYKLNVRDLLQQIRDCEEVNRKTKDPNFKIGRVIILPEEEFDFKERHPLEDILLQNGFVYDFEGSYVGGEDVYRVNLREIKLIYD